MAENAQLESATFTAAASAAGYLYQARLALALCLRYAYSEGGVEVAIERLDDVSFERNGTAFELLQTKHHLAHQADLTDASPDLWKTLRVWCNAAHTDPGLPGRTRLILVTTAAISEGSAAHLLRPTNAGVAIAGESALEAARQLSKVAETSQNESLKPAFNAFLALAPRMRASLLSAVQIFDGQPLAQNLGPIIEDCIRMVAPRGQTAKAREMLEGWWWPRIIRALTSTPVEAISIVEVETKLDEIRESLQRNALTTEFEYADPSEAELKSYEGFGFVRQLRAVGIGGNRIEHAKRDYYRAYAQRSEWARQNVILDGEMERFEATLIEEWQPHFTTMCDKHATTDSESNELREAGQEIYHWVETQARFPFRTIVRRFLNVGSYHMLANLFRVGWHRDFASNRDEG